jgi:hypothetical protein
MSRQFGRILSEIIGIIVGIFALPAIVIVVTARVVAGRGQSGD